MNVLVVGGAGYIGSVVTERLIAAGHRVVVLDNLSLGHREAVSPQATFVPGDMAELNLVTRLLKEHAIRTVMHFSALSLVGESAQRPVDYYQNNVCKSMALVQAMLEAGVHQLIFSSTAAVYGEPQETPIPEEHPLIPTNVYGRTKLIFEHFLSDLSHTTPLCYSALRYFNAAGASKYHGEDHRPESHLIPLALQVALGNRPSLDVYGNNYPTADGTCIRDYIHVLDLADAHLLAMEHLAKHTTSAVYNLGNQQGFSVLEVIKTAEKVTGRSIPFEITARRPGDTSVLVASSEKASKELRWEPRNPSLTAIIESAWQWHCHHPKGYQE